MKIFLLSIVASVTLFGCASQKAIPIQEIYAQAMDAQDLVTQMYYRIFMNRFPAYKDVIEFDKKDWPDFNRSLDDALFHHMFSTDPSKLDTHSIWSLTFGPSSQEILEIVKANPEVAKLWEKRGAMLRRARELASRRKELDEMAKNLPPSDMEAIKRSEIEMNNTLNKLEQILKKTK
jgi:hypothetical protein